MRKHDGTHNFWSLNNPYVDQTKSYEISIKKGKIPFTVISIGTAHDLTEFRKQAQAAHLIAREASYVKYAAARERAIILMTSNLETTGKDVMPETGETRQVFQRCECGAEVVGSNAHSSWCQMFENALSPRAKTSFVPVHLLDEAIEAIDE